MNLNDLTRKTFGRWTVIERVPSKPGSPAWRCKCICGGEKILLGDVLNAGKSRSCGCLSREEKASRPSVHRLRGHPLYSTWARMKDRCYRKGHAHFNRYGGRGITVCDEWKNDFRRFYADNIDRWIDGLTFDRINNDLGYSLENTRWTTMKEQNRNRSNTVMMTLNGEIAPLVVWAERTGLNHMLIRGRILKGWSDEKALTTPVKRKPTASPA